MTIRISSELHDALLALAAASPETEVCGLLFGDETTVRAVSQTVNVATAPADSFEIDPGALIAAHRAMRAGGPNLIGYFHSHPNGVAEPSVRDRKAMAVLGGFWIIIAGDQVTLWTMGACGTEAQRLTLSTILRY